MSKKLLKEDSRLYSTDSKNPVYKALDSAYKNTKEWHECQNILIRNTVAGSGTVAKVMDWGKVHNVNIALLDCSSNDLYDLVSGVDTTTDGEHIDSNLLKDLDKPNTVLLLYRYTKSSPKVRAFLYSLINEHKLGQYTFDNILFTVACASPDGELNAAEASRFAFTVDAGRAITEAYVDGDTLNKFIEIGKKVGITSIDDFCKFGDIFKGEKNISMTDAIKRYCEMKGIKLEESKVLHEEETYISEEDVDDAYEVLTLFLQSLGYSFKDPGMAVEQEVGDSPRLAKALQKAADIYEADLAKAKTQQAKDAATQKYNTAVAEIKQKALNTVGSLGYLTGVLRTGHGGDMSVCATTIKNLQPAIDLLKEVPNIVLYRPYKRSLGGGQFVFCLDVDTSTVNTDAIEWIDFLERHIPKGQIDAYYIKDGKNKFDELRAERVPNAELMGEIATSSDYPEDDFIWGDDE